MTTGASETRAGVKPPWISATAVANLLGVSSAHVAARLAKSGQIRALKIPGMDPRYSHDDVLKLIEQSTQGAEQSTMHASNQVAEQE